MNWQYLIIHHTGAEEKDTDQIRRYHKSLGWRDIGYNFVIERNGLVVPGRSLETPVAHCRAGGMNTKGIGIALIGNLEKHPPRPEQVDALYGLLGRLMVVHHIPAQNVLGHREVPGAATACPGKYFPLEDVRAHLVQTVLPNYAGAGPTLPGQTILRDSVGDGDKPASGAEKSAATDLWLVQVGAFSSRKQAQDYALALHAQGIEAIVIKG